MPKSNCNCWRKVVINEDILSNLIDAFSNWLTDEEACIYAGISPATFYRYIKKNNKFWEQKELLKKKPSIQSKINVVNSIINQKDIDNSKWWLKHKNPDEFWDKSKIEHEWAITYIDHMREKIKKIRWRKK